MAKHLTTCAKQKDKRLSSGLRLSARQQATANLDENGFAGGSRLSAEQDERHACQLCNYEARSVSTLWRHMKHVHNVEVRAGSRPTLTIVTPSVSDPDQCGSVLIGHPRSGSGLSSISWIRIRIGNTDPD